MRHQTTERLVKRKRSSWHMRHPIKATITVLVATGLLAVATTGSSARAFSVTESNYEVIWNNALTGKTKFTFGDAAGHHIECDVTLLAHFGSANTIAKRTEVNQGVINHGEVEGCNNGSATIRTETMPWHLRYRGFTGTLPRIETITTGVIGSRWTIRETGGLACTAGTEAAEPGIGIIEGPGLENIRAEATNKIVLEGGILCAFASPGFFQGRGLIRNLPRTANLTINLI